MQGSCIGPLLFILYVNNIADLFTNYCLCKLYADDLKLYTIVFQLRLTWRIYKVVAIV